MVGVGQTGGGKHFFVAGVPAAITDVLHHRGGEQERILQDDAQLLAQRRLLQAADVVAVDGDAAFIHIVEAAEQADDGGFAGTGGAHEGDGLARRGGQADILQHRLARLISEAYMLEDDLAADR